MPEFAGPWASALSLSLSSRLAHADAEFHFRRSFLSEIPVSENLTVSIFLVAKMYRKTDGLPLR
jgi:hypothetical protein